MTKNISDNNILNYIYNKVSDILDSFGYDVISLNNSLYWFKKGDSTNLSYICPVCKLSFDVEIPNTMVNKIIKLRKKGIENSYSICNDCYENVCKICKGKYRNQKECKFCPFGKNYRPHINDNDGSGGLGFVAPIVVSSGSCSGGVCH